MAISPKPTRFELADNFQKLSNIKKIVKNIVVNPPPPGWVLHMGSSSTSRTWFSGRWMSIGLWLWGRDWGASFNRRFSWEPEEGRAHWLQPICVRHWDGGWYDVRFSILDWICCYFCQSNSQSQTDSILKTCADKNVFVFIAVTFQKLVSTLIFFYVKSVI